MCPSVDEYTITVLFIDLILKVHNVELTSLRTLWWPWNEHALPQVWFSGWLGVV